MDYQPPAHETDLLCNAYIDESSQTKHRYLVIGGLVIPWTHADLFQKTIVDARAGSIVPTHQTSGEPRVMKWQKADAFNFEIYKKVVDLTFDFRRDQNLPARKEMGMHCVAVDTSKKPLLKSGDGDIEVGFDKEFHFLCTVVFPKWYRSEIFALYPDKRDGKRPLPEARDIMNRAVYKHADNRPGLLRFLEYREPDDYQALQITDILIGALAYKLNGHYSARDANKGKKALCDHIWSRFKLSDPFATSERQVRRFMTWIHRPTPPNTKRSGPQNVR